MHRCLLLTLLLFAGVVNVHAEDGFVRGEVRDAEDNPIKSASISVLDARLQEVRGDTTSSDSGQFVLQLPLGEYVLNVAAAGHDTLRQTVRVQPGQNRKPLILRLQTSKGQNRSLSLEPIDNSSALTLDYDFLQSLSDNPMEFKAKISQQGAGTVTNIIGAGAQTGGAGTAAGLTGGSILATTTNSGSPQLPGPQAMLLGSADITVNGQPSSMVPKDQIEEVWLHSDPITAEFSTPGFARTEVLTARPSNAIHGMAAFNFRDESLNASTSPGFRPSAQSRYFHGVINAPLIRNKLFSSFAAQRLSSDQGRTIAYARDLNGDIYQEFENGQTDQTFSGRVQYDASANRVFYVNGWYRSLKVPNIGVGGFALPEVGSHSSQRNWEQDSRAILRFSPDHVNEIRFQVERSEFRSEPNHEALQIYVNGEILKGGSSSHSEDQSTRFRLDDLFTWNKNRLELRMGVQNRLNDERSATSSLLLGEYLFLTKSDYAAGTPYSFQQSSGVSRNSVRQFEFAGFMQGTYHATRRLSLSAGMRFEAQTNLNDYNNLDPRAAFAFALRPTMVIRGSAGIFRQRLPSETVATIHRLQAGTQQFGFVVSNPTYPIPPELPAPSASSSTPVPLDLSHLQAPYLANGSLSVEKLLQSGIVISATAEFVRGNHQFRTGTVLASPAVAPAMVVYASAGSLSSRTLSARFKTPRVKFFGLPVETIGEYAYNSSFDDNVSINGTNWKSYWARTNSIPRHSTWVGSLFSLPGGFSASLLVFANSGAPYSTTILSSFGSNPGATRNTNDAPAYFSPDLQLSKIIYLPERLGAMPRKTLTLFGYFQNVANRSNPVTINGNPFSFLYGQISGYYPGRRIELGLRLHF
jgi:hypothetical protein